MSARTYEGLDVHSDLGGLYPWKSHFVDVGDGVKQAYVDEGPRDARRTFVCFHGNPTWSFLYRNFIRRLSARHRVIAIDHVGFGRSDKPRDPSYYSLERHVVNATRTLAQADVQHGIPIVQDWGGPIGMGWAARHPERIDGVVVLNTWAFVKEPQMQLPWIFRKLVLGPGGWRRTTQGNLFTELILRRLGVKPLSEAVLNGYRAPHLRPEDRAGVGRFPQLIPITADRGHETWRTMATIEDDLAALRDKPALIVWGLKDRAFGKPQLERWTRVFSRVDGPHRLPNAAHYLQEDAPDEILGHIERWVEGV